MSGLFSNFKAATAEDIRRHVSSPALTALYKAVGVPYGEKIPLKTIDAALSRMPDMSIQKKMALKSELARFGIIPL
jgi:hypothetical protein